MQLDILYEQGYLSRKEKKNRSSLQKEVKKERLQDPRRDSISGFPLGSLKSQPLDHPGSQVKKCIFLAFILLGDRDITISLRLKL